jgi:LysM repeat protein
LARANLPIVLLTITIFTVAYMFFSLNGEIQKHFYNFLSSFRTTQGFTFSQSRTDRIDEIDIANFPVEYSTTMHKKDSGLGSDVCQAYSNGVVDHIALVFRYDFKTLPVEESKIIEKSLPQKKEKTARVSPDNNSLKAQFSGDEYSVKKGDNLYRIARKFNTSVRRLKALNNLKSDNIRIGQLLIVPKIQEEKPKQRIKIVKKKDDLDNIKVDRSSFYQPVGGLPVHSLTLSNEGDMAYRDIKLKISYYSSLGMEMGYETVTLPIVVPPHSRKNYIKEGVSIKPNQGDVYSTNVEILGATPLMRIVDEVKLDR